MVEKESHTEGFTIPILGSITRAANVKRTQHILRVIDSRVTELPVGPLAKGKVRATVGRSEDGSRQVETWRHYPHNHSAHFVIKLARDESGDQINGLSASCE